MTSEKTASEDSSIESSCEDLNREQVLDMHNPVKNPGSDIVYEDIYIESMEIPCIDNILKSLNPTIRVSSTTNMGRNVTFQIALDRFCRDKDKDSLSITGFCNSIGIDKTDINKILYEEIPVTIHRHRNESDIYVDLDARDVELDEYVTHHQTQINLLSDLWRAEKYHKCRITSVRQLEYGMIGVRVEIPYLDATETLRFSSETGNKNSFGAFYETITGSRPINTSEISSIVGEEIPVSYKGKFSLSKTLQYKVEDNRINKKQKIMNYCNKFVNNIISRDL